VDVVVSMVARMRRGRAIRRRRRPYNGGTRWRSSQGCWLGRKNLAASCSFVDANACACGSLTLARVGAPRHVRGMGTDQLEPSSLSIVGTTNLARGRHSRHDRTSSSSACLVRLLDRQWKRAGRQVVGITERNETKRNGGGGLSLSVVCV
jgi:hypothetical protein